MFCCPRDARNGLKKVIQDWGGGGGGGIEECHC